MSSSIDETTKGVGLEPSNSKIHEPDVYEDEAEKSIRNSKAVSSWTIFASALANFSDGYQNNLVRLSLQTEW